MTALLLSMLFFATAVVQAEPPLVGIRDVVAGKYASPDDIRPPQVVRISGTVRAVLRDDIDSRYIFLALEGDGTIVHVSVRGADYGRLKHLIGAEVVITGKNENGNVLNRHQIGPTLGCQGLSDIKIVTPATGDPYAVPGIEKLDRVRPFEMQHLGRHLVRGRVLAVTDASRVVLRAENGRLVFLELADGKTPLVGTGIEATGFPETDYYNLSLVYAEWRPAIVTVGKEPTSVTVTADRIVSNANDVAVFDFTFQGRVLKIEGEIVNLPVDESVPRIMHIRNGGNLVPVTIAPGLRMPDAVEVGAVVEVTGLCLMDVGPWHPSGVFGAISGFTIATRTLDDIRVLRSAPWWTPVKLFVLVVVLVFALVVFVFLRLVEKRSSALRLKERTHLAVELHDSLSQTLSGVSMELEAASACAEDVPSAMTSHLDVAKKALGSCRCELRNCLWDLRCDALGEKVFTTAIERTLAPCVDASRIRVRFAVRLGLVPDPLAHAVLSIVRELAVNAIRHGGAERVMIAGNLADGWLRFSVRDNGCGFDPDEVPGVMQGHFGLEGVRERVRRFEGHFILEARPGCGAFFRIEFPLKEKK